MINAKDSAMHVYCLKMLESNGNELTRYFTTSEAAIAWFIKNHIDTYDAGLFSVHEGSFRADAAGMMQWRGLGCDDTLTNASAP